MGLFEIVRFSTRHGYAKDVFKGPVLATGFACLFLISGCTAPTASLSEKLTRQRVEMPQQCVGWEKIPLKNSSRYALLQQDQRLVVNIDAHNLRGRNLGCWQ